MKQKIAFVVALLVAGSASAQSLVELAEKEKKRREESRAEGKTAKEYTDVKGTTMTSKGDSESSDDSDRPKLDSNEKSSGPEDSVEWKSIHGKYNVRYLYLLGVMKQLDGRAERWCAPISDETRPTDWASEQAKRRERCQEVRDEQAELRGELRELESEVLREAKRLGVRAGEARLGR